jgi:hypothetical protein
MALMMGAGAKANPMRHPVIAYVFESEPATTTLSLAPSAAAIENGLSS